MLSVPYPNVRTKMRYFQSYSNTSGGVTAWCLSIGASINALTDFTDFVTAFSRWTITHARLVVLPGIF